MLFGDVDAGLAAGGSDAGVAPSAAGFTLGENTGSAALLDEDFGFMLIEAGSVIQLRTFATDFGRGDGVPPVIGDVVRCDDARPSFYFYKSFVSKDGKEVPGGLRITLQAENVVVLRADQLGATMPQPVGDRDLVTTLAARTRVTAPATLRPWSGDVPPSCMRAWAPGRFPARRLSEWSESEMDREADAQRVQMERLLMWTPGELLAPGDDEAAACAKCIEFPGVGATFFGPLLVATDSEALLRKGKTKPLVDSSIEQPVQIVTESGSSEFTQRLTLMFANAVLTSGCANPDTFLQFSLVYGPLVHVAARCAPEVAQTGRSALNADGSTLGAIVYTPTFTLHPGHKDWVKGTSKYTPMVSTNLADIVRQRGFAVPLDYVLRAFNISGKGVLPPNPFHAENMLHQMAGTPPVYNVGEYEGNVRGLTATHEFRVLFLEDEDDELSETRKLRALVDGIEDPAAAATAVAACIEGKAHQEVAVRTLGRIIYAVALGVGAERGAPSEFDRASRLEGRIVLDDDAAAAAADAEALARAEEEAIAAAEAASRKRAATAAAATAKKSPTTTTTTTTTTLSSSSRPSRPGTRRPARWTPSRALNPAMTTSRLSPCLR